MANTIPGGVYLGADGSHYDANGKPVNAETVEQFKTQQRAESAKRSAQASAQPAQPALTSEQVLAFLAGQATAVAAPAKQEGDDKLAEKAKK